MSKQKYYVVWSGKRTGIFTSWDKCKKQVIGVKGARYKSYPTRHLAEEAFQHGADINKQLKNKSHKRFIKDSISVDAACSGNPGDMEYRGVSTADGKELFHYGPARNGTNNIGEFLAIVHALAYLKKKGSTIPIYSDSLIAINWIRKKEINTTIVRDTSTRQVWNLIDRALIWLQTNTYENELLKWETQLWGEIKADFGRK